VPSAAPSKIIVAFCGFTNDATGAQLASFRICNLGGGELFRWPLYNIEERGQVNPLARGACGGGCVLRPGQSSVCLLPAPNNSAPWRAIFLFSEENWRRKLADLPVWTREVLPSRLLTLPVREGLSDWVGDTSTVADAPFRSRMATVFVRSFPKPQPQTITTNVSSPSKSQ
jgi:hypothetical protein